MRWLFMFLCMLALGVMGCSETGGTGGSGGSAGIDGNGGTDGDGGTGGTGGIGGAGGTGGCAGSGGSGGAVPCESHEDCDDGRECSENYCNSEGVCQHELFFCPCEVPLSCYCSASECPTWEQAVAEAQRYCDNLEARVEVGRCRDFQYVEINFEEYEVVRRHGCTRGPDRVG